MHEKHIYKTSWDRMPNEKFFIIIYLYTTPGKRQLPVQIHFGIFWITLGTYNLTAQNQLQKQDLEHSGQSHFNLKSITNTPIVSSRRNVPFETKPCIPAGCACKPLFSVNPITTFTAQEELRLKSR